jgi:hypothetical protein
MKTTYEFTPMPSSSTVAGLVTAMVSAWFLMAAAAIFMDPARGRAGVEAIAQPRATGIAIAPEARFKITVEASGRKS